MVADLALAFLTVAGAYAALVLAIGPALLRRLRRGPSSTGGPQRDRLTRDDFYLCA